MKLTFECDCGNKVETKLTLLLEEREDEIRFEDGTFFSGDDSGYIYLDCGKCGKSVEVAG